MCSSKLTQTDSGLGLKNQSDCHLVTKSSTDLYQEEKKQFKVKILFLLHKLPNNGDWLFVTITPQPNDDSSQELIEPQKILNHLSSNDLDLLKLIYERVKGYEQTIISSSDHVRSKAATLLSTAGFTSAIILGLTASMFSILPKIPFWCVILELLLLFLLISHLLHSLSLAIKSMTKETIVKPQMNELLSIGKPIYDIKEYYKEAISQDAAYSVKTRTMQLKRINELICGQHAFRYGIIYFALILLFNFLLVLNIPNDKNYIAENNKLITVINKKGNDVVKAVDKLSEELAKLRLVNSNKP